MNSEDLKTRRNDLDLTQRALADLLGISIDTLKSWELGRNPIPKIASIAINAVLKDVEAERAAGARQAARQSHIQALAGNTRK